ncbi:MAG: hypothetical protein JXR51_07445 [Bacteroidales bacterium]|nr:hypothetical protein [Bacteroidales bacterium]MBN2756997.1 hypothetical protein [Bacteroidales bacterium]
MSEEIVKLFEKEGGEFISSPSFILEKLKDIKAFIFDWDGVFNNGQKADGFSSSYTEADSMGTNLLRFGYWLVNSEQVPITAIITGENNQTAIKLANREHFNNIYYKFVDKADALNHFTSLYKIKKSEIAFCFDDVIDLPIAKQCGLKFLVRRNASVMFKNFVIKNHYCDYITAQEGGNHAIREISELILTLFNTFEKVIEERTNFSDIYQKYLMQRNNIQTEEYSENKFS